MGSDSRQDHQLNCEGYGAVVVYTSVWSRRCGFAAERSWEFDITL
jgi:hypothetical protein